MIRLEVTAVDGQPPAPPLYAEFDEFGGDIGRADSNTLVLPDPERYVSRVHATIVFRGGRYLVIDKGSATPVVVNGRAVGNGREAALKPGDELRIASYTLRVAETRSAPGAAASRGTPSAPPQMAGTDRLETARQVAAGGDPSNAFGEGMRQPAGAGGIFDDLLGAAAAPTASSALASTHPPGPRPPNGGTASSEGFPLDLDLGGGEAAGGAPDLDRLFGLDGAPATPDALGVALSTPKGASSSSSAADPFALLEPKRAIDATHRDDVPDIHEPFPIAGPAPTPAAPGGGSQRSMVVSWETPTGGDGSAIKTVVLPSAGPPPTPAPAPVAAPASPSGSGANGDELLRAFLEGAGVPNLQMSTTLTPQLARMLGQLLRESTEGTRDLLFTRTVIRREFGADVTIINPRENNPLKFSPNVEAALSHLLAPQGAGFMTPLRAMRDAYHDLRAHQFAVMAGLRAALAGVLHRFDPGELERRLTQRSLMDSVLPMNRKARLWDLFQELYKEIAGEAEDDFHALFGRAFVKAYEAELDRIADEPKEPGKA